MRWMMCSWSVCNGLMVAGCLIGQAITIWGADTVASSVGGRSAVRVEIVDRELAPNRWPDWPVPTPVHLQPEVYETQAFGFTRTPWRYTGTGVRQDRGSPYWLRASATVPLKPGKYRFLLRSRGAARLFIHDRQLVALSFPKGIQDGQDPLPTLGLQLPGVLPLAPGDREELVETEIKSGEHAFRLEILVGGLVGKKPRRPELGESLVAVAAVGSETFHILSPTLTIPLTEAGWRPYQRDCECQLDELEAIRRQQAFADHADYWQQRHELAREYAAAQMVLFPPVPDTFAATPSQHPIDRFLQPEWDAALRRHHIQTRPAVEYHRDIAPVLQQHCWTCHSVKPNGGLRLDRRDRVLQGGDSGEPAVVPGQPERSELLRRLRADASEMMPPSGQRLPTATIQQIETWIRDGANWPDLPPTALAALPPDADDWTLLRRLYLDVVGTVPSLAEIEAFCADTAPQRWERWVDRLLADRRWADAWMPFWLTALAENPSLINPTLNNTGPFRWWLYEGLLDNKPWDVMVTELVSLSGSELGGGPAGFGLAAQNDVPMAAKAGILASTFLATDMKCARCHDAPYHASTQADLFQLAALLAGEPVRVPASSSIPAAVAARRPLVTVTLKPGQALEPNWPFPHFLDPTDPQLPPLSPVHHETTRPEPMSAAATVAAPAATVAKATSANLSRQRLALWLTAPSNRRFAQVMVNRVWRKFIGRGLVEPGHDWETAHPSHPQLLDWLALDFMQHGYDLKHLSRRILTAAVYRRVATTDPDLQRLFVAPCKRRLTPEVLVDVLFDGVGQTYDTELLCLDLESGRPHELALNLGRPRRAWQFSYLANDRDRPSLNLPKAQALTALLSAFGWVGDRQANNEPELAANLLQAALLANGVTSRHLVRLTDTAPWTRLALQAASPAELVDWLFQRLLTRLPTAKERQTFIDLLTPGFAERCQMTEAELQSWLQQPGLDPACPPPRQSRISWASHLTEDANQLRLAEEQALQQGPTPTSFLHPDWRERLEDTLWAILNAPEMVYYP